MKGKAVSVDEIFAELRAKNEAAYWDPAAVAKREAASEARRQRVEAEIAAGLRDEDGWPIEAEPDEEDEDEERDPDAEPEEF